LSVTDVEGKAGRIGKLKFTMVLP